MGEERDGVGGYGHTNNVLFTLTINRLITIRYTAPVENLFWKRAGMHQIGEKILKLIYDMNFDSHPLIFHVFSNGGAFLYQHIALALRRSKSPINICGMIFDSAPGDRRIVGLYRAITAIYGKERRCNALLSAFMAVAAILLWTFEVGNVICCTVQTFF